MKRMDVSSTRAPGSMGDGSSIRVELTAMVDDQIRTYFIPVVIHSGGQVEFDLPEGVTHEDVLQCDLTCEAQDQWIVEGSRGEAT